MTRLLLADVLPLEDPAAYAFLYGMTSSERKRTADSFRFMKDRMLSVGASALLDAGLREFGLRERDMTYGRSEHGKPFFLNAPDIHFNISHSASKVAVAFSDREVGCDIEEAFAAGLSAQSVEQEAAKCLEMARRFFSREEYLAVKAAESPSECIRTFYRCWTLKESYMKATGLGLSLAPDSFSVAALCTGGSGSLLRHTRGLGCLSPTTVDVGDVDDIGDSCFLRQTGCLDCLSPTTVDVGDVDDVGDSCFLRQTGCLDCLSPTTVDVGDVDDIGDSCFLRQTGCLDCLSPTTVDVGDVDDVGDSCFLRQTGCLDCLSHKVADGFVFYPVDSFEGYECALCCRPEAGVPELEFVRLGERK